MSYVRPMRAWWKRDPFFMAYMARELTAFAVLAYAVVLAVGFVRLSQGEAAWNGWVEAVRSPWGGILHGIFLVSFVIHAKSWFEIMPKTMPMIVVGGKRLAPARITQAGFAASIATAIGTVLVARWVLS